jgi:hypothetical protein
MPNFGSASYPGAARKARQIALLGSEPAERLFMNRPLPSGFNCSEHSRDQGPFTYSLSWECGHEFQPTSEDFPNDAFGSIFSHVTIPSHPSFTAVSSRYLNHSITLSRYIRARRSSLDLDALRLKCHITASVSRSK